MEVEGLIEQLKTIPDWRRDRKVQHPLWVMLLMSLLGVMSRYSSLRGLEDFMKRHQHEVVELFVTPPCTIWQGMSMPTRLPAIPNSNLTIGSIALQDKQTTD